MSITKTREVFSLPNVHYAAFFYVEAFYIIEVLVSTFTFNNIYKHMKSITCIINYNAIDSCPILTFTKHNISQFILKMR